MNSTLSVSVAMMLVVLVAGCATHRSPHGGPSMGLAVDVDTPLGGVDASIGVHHPNRGGYGRTGGGCDTVLAAMEDAQPLMDWATNGGQGIQKKNAYGGASASRRGGGANCSAHTSGSSVQYNGQNLPPPGIQMNGQAMRGGMNPSSYQEGGQQQYRRVDPREYRVPERGPRGGGYYGR